MIVERYPSIDAEFIRGTAEELCSVYKSLLRHSDRHSLATPSFPKIDTKHPCTYEIHIICGLAELVKLDTRGLTELRIWCKVKYNGIEYLY